MKKTIVFDIDDTLAKMRHYVAEQVSKQLNKKVNPEHITHASVEKAFPNVCWDKIQNHIISTNGLLYLEPEVSTHYTLNTVKDNGYKIVIVTARGYHPNGYKESVEWFNKHNLPFDKIYCVDHQIGKDEVIKDLGEVTLYVDDHPQHVNSTISLKNVKYPVIIDRPWNRHYYHEKVKRVFKIDEILNHLE